MKLLSIDSRPNHPHQHFTNNLLSSKLFFLILLLAGCNTNSMPTVIPTSTQQTSLPQTAVSTPSLTSGPSAAMFTAIPSPTVQPTPTTTDEPGWTIQKASQLIEELHNYPETLSMQERGRFDSGYYYAFRYEGLAELESALRFPQAEQAVNWQFDGVYNQYQSSSEDVTSLYAGLIADALNQKTTSLADLETWCNDNLSFQLEVFSNIPPQGYQQSIILHFYNDQNKDYETGSFAIWLLQKDDVYLCFPLKNALEDSYGEGNNTLGMADLTADGIKEVIIQNTEWDSFGMHNGEMSIYRLDQVPPQKITFDAEPPDAYISTWSIDQSGSPSIITFTIPAGTHTSIPCRDFTPGWQYQWKDGELKFISFITPSMEEMEADPFCTRIMVSNLGEDQFLQNATVLATYIQLLDLPFITKIEDCFYCDTHPLLIEEERFDLALFLSEKGDETGAARQMNLIMASTDPDVIEWRKNALATFYARKDPLALIWVCENYTDCYLDTSEKIALVPLDQFAEIVDLLEEMDVNIFSSGEYDFDLDGQDEIWLMNNIYEGLCSELWVLDKANNQIFSRNIGFVCLQDETSGDSEVEITELSPSSDVPRYQLTVAGEGVDDSEFLYWSLEQDDPTLPFDQAYDMAFEIQNKLLLSQISPSEAQSQLMGILNSPIELTYWMDQLQTHVSYLIGLTQELSGETDQAIETYQKLAQDYPDSPYTMMALAKLEALQ